MENKPTANNPGGKNRNIVPQIQDNEKKKGSTNHSHLILFFSIKYEQIPVKQRARINYTNE